MSIRSAIEDLRLFPWYVQAFAFTVLIGVTIAVPSLFVCGFITGGGHTPIAYDPSGDLPLDAYAYTPTGLARVEVCPSVLSREPRRRTMEVERAATWWARLGYPSVDVVAGDCGGPPDVDSHTLQLRLCGDGVEPYVHPCIAPDGTPRVDTVVWDHPKHRGVAYWDPLEGLPGTMRHTLGHALGIRGHTAAASSVMADPAGTTSSTLEVTW